MRPSPTAKALAATTMSASRVSASVLRMMLSCYFELSASRNIGRHTAISINAEVGLVFESTLELLQQAHPFGRLQDVGLDGRVDLRLHPLLEVAPVVLRHGQHLADGLAGDLFLDVEAAVLVRVEEDVDLVHAAEEVVDIAHDVLVGAGEKDAEVVG